jgi:hypothetical protein
MIDHCENVRLVPLDIWERAWIRDRLKEALTLAQHVPEAEDAATLRLLDLFRKVDPAYPPRRDEDGHNVVEMR